ncbi:hypothetical protein [Dawidia soli]|uniref:Uncharacterized protein n=1 Tax=Dawidia soli TaxID=2782352 RepID=A0AAP2DCA0_9BACT|nr:hypothetical protein [Dawidia soli]MBT1689188.1 hypothetical protein [Dawidia soli]
MIHTAKHLLTVLLCLACILAVHAQNTYLVRYEHKASRQAEKESRYFYLQEVEAGADPAQANILTLDHALYRLYYFRFHEASPSSYFGCSKYGDQAAGEELSLHDLLSDSVLYACQQTQLAIDAQCDALFENRGRPNSLLVVEINDQERIKMLKIHVDVCVCKVSQNKFSALSDTLAMPRKVVETYTFTPAEKSYWQQRAHHIPENALVKSCFPPADPFAQLYQVGQK